MTRLPTVGGDDNEWGTILNEYLAVEHNTDGTQKLLSEDTSRTIYVATTGDDTTGDGTALLPYLTITKALSTINEYISPDIIITISIGEGTWTLTDEDINYIASFKGTGNVNLTGTMELVESGFTMGSAEADDPLTYAVSGGNTASWTENQFQGMFLYTGSVYYPITHNTDTTLSLVRGITGTSIYELKTTITINDASIYFSNFSFYDLKINFTQAITFYGLILIDRCYINASSYINFRILSESSINRTAIIGGSNPLRIYNNLSINYVYIYKNGNFSLIQNLKDKEGFNYFNNVVFENPNTSSNSCGLYEQTTSFVSWAGNSYLKFVNSNTAIRIDGNTFISYTDFSKFIIKNTNYFIKEHGSLANYDPCMFLTKSSNFYGAPNTRYFYDSMYEFTNEKHRRNLRIEGLIYPESDDNLSATLTDNTTTNVIIGSKAQNRSIIIDYTITRGTTYEAGRLRVIHNGTTLSLTEDTPTGDDVGVTFAVAFNTDEIQLQCALTSTGTGATMTYSANRVMITPVVI